MSRKRREGPADSEDVTELKTPRRVTPSLTDISSSDTLHSLSCSEFTTDRAPHCPRRQPTLDKIRSTRSMMPLITLTSEPYNATTSTSTCAKSTVLSPSFSALQQLERKRCNNSFGVQDEPWQTF